MKYMCTHATSHTLTPTMSYIKIAVLNGYEYGKFLLYVTLLPMGELIEILSNKSKAII